MDFGRRHTTRSGRAARPAPDGPRLVCFDVRGRRDLARRAAAAAPGVRFAWRLSWTDDPGEPGAFPLVSRRRPAAGLWFWSGTVEQLAAQARAVLLGFVHPLVARGVPYCVGFPFGGRCSRRGR